MIKRRYKSKPPSGLPEFFEKHTKIIKDNYLKCEECGCSLRGTVDEVAHILPKQYFKSIKTEDRNVIYLCGMFSDNNCHSKYDDGTNDIVKDMNIFKKVSERFEELKELITEKLNYKHYDRWQV